VFVIVNILDYVYSLLVCQTSYASMIAWTVPRTVAMFVCVLCIPALASGEGKVPAVWKIMGGLLVPYFLFLFRFLY